ncbi:MAG: DNA translocase FtsK 4TM domain-containing protein [Actinobacteria bacterium]|nr:DNA translocase FtsK 4TM domain-containing protein [Actinomycetota bacterium]
MATKTSPKRRPSASRRPAAKKRPASKTSTRQILSPWARDAVGIGLVVLAGLAVLSVWVEAAGPAGVALAWLLRGAFGVAAVLFPIVGVWWGIVLLRDVAREDRVRIFIGFAVMTAGLLGLLSVLRGLPSPASGFAGLHDAAGLVGALVAWPLARALSAYGAVVVCLGLAVLGSLILTGTPIASVIERVGALRTERAERDPVGIAGRRSGSSAGYEDEEVDDDREGGEAEPRRRSIREALGFDELPDDDPVIVLPDLSVEVQEGEEPAGGPLPDAAPAGRARSARAGSYRLPPIDHLRTAPPSTADGRAEDEVMQALERTLVTFGVAARVTGAHRGPTVTMYEVEVAAGTKVQKVLSLSSDIAYALATPDVRIIAPIPGKSAIGIEVPNKHRDFVMLGDILRSKAAREATHPLTVALGKDVHGRAQMVNLATMPHVLIAGATGAGKSSLVNSFITSILMRATPDDVRMVLIDPKRVELSHFAEVPHLLTPVIVHPKRATEALEWIVREMEMRYETLATVGVRDIDGYEEGLREGTLRLPVGHEDRYQHMPFIVVVIDELADLMMVAPRAVEDAICRIAQMARAVGIHLVVATQRPSVDVVTGLIKANIPSRIALMTSSQADSRVVLDQNGAEKLVGHGDMLFAPANASKPVRLQGAWVTESEIHEISGFIREQRQVVYETTVEGLGLPPTESEMAGGVPGDDDDLLNQAAELVIRSQLGSTSMLQRKLKVGFARAGRLMDLLEDRGVVGPSLGSKARDVLITIEEWQERRSA